MRSTDPYTSTPWPVPTVESPPPPPSIGTAITVVPHDGTSLPVTGGEVLSLALAGGTALLIGAVCVVVKRLFVRAD